MSQVLDRPPRQDVMCRRAGEVASSKLTCRAFGIPYGYRFVDGRWRKASWLRAQRAAGNFTL